jgi:hypothetical protein
MTYEYLVYFTGVELFHGTVSQYVAHQTSGYYEQLTDLASQNCRVSENSTIPPTSQVEHTDKEIKWTSLLIIRVGLIRLLGLILRRSIHYPSLV